MKQQKSTATTSTSTTLDAPLARVRPTPDVASALQVILRAFQDGSLQIHDRVPVITQAPAAVPTKPRSAELSRAMADVPEPKRQRKVRVMPVRKMYSLAKVKTAVLLRELQSLAPAGAAIVVYLSEHPKTSAPQLCTQLDLAKKTIDNWLSQLRQMDLVIAEDVPKTIRNKRSKVE